MPRQTCRSPQDEWHKVGIYCPTITYMYSKIYCCHYSPSGLVYFQLTQTPTTDGANVDSSSTIMSPCPTDGSVHIRTPMTYSLVASHIRQQHSCTAVDGGRCAGCLTVLTSPSFFSLLAENSSGSFTLASSSLHNFIILQESKSKLESWYHRPVCPSIVCHYINGLLILTSR